MNPYMATPWQWISLRSVTEPLITAETDHHKFYAPILVAPHFRNNGPIHPPDSLLAIKYSIFQQVFTEINFNRIL